MTPRDGADARSGKSSRLMFLLALVCSAFVALAGLCQVARAEADSARARSLAQSADSQRGCEGASLLGVHDQGLAQHELAIAEPEDSDQDASLERAGVCVAGRAVCVASSNGKVKLVARRAHVPSPLGSPELARAPPTR